MRTVLIGRIPEGEALVVSRVKQVGQALEPQLLGLVRAATHAVRAGAHGKAAHFHTTRPQLDAVRGVSFGPAGKKMIRERVQGDSAGGGITEEMAAIHGGS